MAAATALVLGALGAALLVVGHHPWDGAVIETFGEGRGLHRGDVLAVLPALVALRLAVWCWRRRS